MREKLYLFNELHLTTKEEILFELNEYSDSLNIENGFSVEVIESLKSFISRFSEIIKKHNLPELNNWWQYRYIITGYGAELDMCHCSSIEYSSDGEEITEENEDDSFTLLRMSAEYITPHAYFKKFNIPFSNVEDLIRTGRVQHVLFKDDKWYISELQDLPSTSFVPMFFTLPVDEKNSFFLHNPGLKGCRHIDLLFDKTRKSFSAIYRRTSGKNDIQTMTGDEVGNLVLLLHKSPDVLLHTIFDIMYRPFPKKENVSDNNTISKVIKSFHKKEEDELEYGSVIITQGNHKGRIGFYDDDDYNRCIVYFGDPALTRDFYKVPRRYLSNNITSEQLFNRLKWLYNRIFDASGHDLHYEFLLELFYCYSLFNHRFIDAIYKNPVGDNPMVFISHATEDLSLAEMIAIDLKNCGYDFFLDAYSIFLGNSIPRRVSEGLDQSCALLILVSDSYNSSVFCNDEWESFYHKFSKEKPNSIIPILIGDAKLPTLLCSKKYERFTGVNYSKVIESIKTSLHLITQEQSNKG